MNNPFITIATFELPSQMHVIKSKLESEGIECFAKDELTVQVHNFYSNAIGGVKLQVRQSDVEKALPILKAAGIVPEQAQTERTGFFKKIDDFTQKMPVIGGMIFELRLIILGLILVLAVLIPFAIIVKT